METTLQLTTQVIECIDGKDDHLTINVQNTQSLVLSSEDGENRMAIKELEGLGGAIVITNNNGKIMIDATDVPIPVKINGKLVTRNELHVHDVLRIGNSIWRLNAPAAVASQHTTVDNIRKSFTNMIGLEELRDFKLANIFSEVFKKHSMVDMEDQLITGTFRNTPSIVDIETNWGKPWLFSRMLLASTLAAVILIIGFNTFHNPNFIPGIIFVGSFAVPISTLIFFLEMNAPRNISIFFTMLLMLLGGVVSLIVTSVFFDRLEFLERWLSTPAAGIIEESAKILCVIFIMGRFARYKWSLNGLLFGAAIGTGFAAFESSGYALRFMGDFDTGVHVITLRGLLAPFGHIIWTGNAAAALWLVKGDKKFDWSMLKDMRFVRVFLSSVILHMLWDTDYVLLSVPFVEDLKYVILGVLGWAITFRLIQSGLKQLNEARHAEVERLSAV